MFTHLDIVHLQKGAYRAPLLLQVYAYHLGLIEGKTDAWYGDAIGALAFAATAVSFILSLSVFL